MHMHITTVKLNGKGWNLTPPSISLCHTDIYLCANNIPLRHRYGCGTLRSSCRIASWHHKYGCMQSATNSSLCKIRPRPAASSSSALHNWLSVHFPSSTIIIIVWRLSAIFAIPCGCTYVCCSQIIINLKWMSLQICHRPFIESPLVADHLIPTVHPIHPDGKTDTTWRSRTENSMQRRFFCPNILLGAMSKVNPFGTVMPYFTRPP